jgi:hypothetical protein
MVFTRPLTGISFTGKMSSMALRDSPMGCPFPYSSGLFAYAHLNIPKLQALMAEKYDVLAPLHVSIAG